MGKIKHQTITSRTEFFYYAFRNILLVSVPLLLISALMLSVSHSSADTTSSDDITLKLDVACTVSSVVSSPHNALDMHVGQYKADIGNTDISVFCNDNNGYSVYAIGNSNSMNGNTDLVGSIGDNYNIHTGTNTTGNSSWAMKLTAGTGTGSGSETTPPTIVNGYNSYSIVPNNYTLVATRPSGTSMNPDSSVSGSYFSTTYAIYAASTQPAGTYNGKVKYVMVHPDNSIHNTIPDLEAAFAAAGKQRVYQDSGGNYYYSMQDMDSTICASVTRNGEATATQLIDIRDNKLYWVAKLTDGHCWMTQNLDLDLTSGVALTSETTDLNDNSLNGAYQAGYSYDAANRIISWSPTNTTRNYQHSTGTPWSNNYNVSYSLDPGEWYWDGDDSTANCGGYFTAAACKDHFTGFTGSDPASARDNVNKHLSVGNYYNWSAAIASDNSGSLTTNTYSDITKNPQNSICPKGWRLPTISNMAYTTANSTSEFGRLNQLYNGGGSTDPKLISNPLWFVRSGLISNGSFINSGSNAYYWSSTVYDSGHAYCLGFSATVVGPAGSSYRQNGWSVRCVAR